MKIKLEDGKLAYIFSQLLFSGLLYLIILIGAGFKFVYLKLRIYKLYRPYFWAKITPLVFAFTIMCDWASKAITNYDNGAPISHAVVFFVPYSLMMIGFILIYLSLSRGVFTNKRLILYLVGFALLALLGRFIPVFSTKLFTIAFFVYLVIQLIMSSSDASIIQKIPFLKNTTSLCKQLFSENTENTEYPFNPNYFIDGVVSIAFALSVCFLFAPINQNLIFDIAIKSTAIAIIWFFTICYPWTAGMLMRYKWTNKVLYYSDMESIAFSLKKTSKGFITDLLNTEFFETTVYEPYNYKTQRSYYEQFYDKQILVKKTTYHDEVQSRKQTHASVHTNERITHGAISYFKIVFYLILRGNILVMSPILLPCFFLIELIKYPQNGVEKTRNDSFDSE